MAVMAQSQRRIVFGLTAALNTVLAIAVLVLAVWLADTYRRQVDLTRSGVNSLSPRTTQLVSGLKTDVRISGVYTVLSEYQKFAQKRRDMVADLLKLYEGAGHGRVTADMINPMKNEEAFKALWQRIREKPAFAAEIKPYEEALADFPEINRALAELAQREQQTIEGFMQTEQSLASSANAGRVLRYFETTGQESQQTLEAIKQETAGDRPGYGKAVRDIRDYFTRARANLDEIKGWMTGEKGALPPLSPGASQFFSQAAGRYDPLIQQIANWLDRTQGLGPVKLEEVYDSLSRYDRAPPIVVETADDVRVVTFDEVWPPRRGNAPTGEDEDPREFAGEQAVSSAILAVTEKDKPSVIFVRFGGGPLLVPDFSNVNMANLRQIPQAPYGQLRDILEKENFIAEEWNVAESLLPPETDGTGPVVFVVLPPAPPPQPDPRRPSAMPPISPEQVKAVTDAVDAAGAAVFMAGYPLDRGFDESRRPYEYNPYLESEWGIDVQTDYVAMVLTPSADKERPGLWLPVGRDLPSLLMLTPESKANAVLLTNHPIAAPIGSLPSAFMAAAPLKIEDKPGVTHDVVAEVGETPDIWATRDIAKVVREDFQKEGGTKPRETDIRPPFPLFVVAERPREVAASQPAGEAASKPARPERIAVIASQFFAADDIAQAQGLTIGPEGFQAVLRFPANADLFVNTLHWLTGETARIALGPKSNDFPRLDRLHEGTEARVVQGVLVAGWPAAILLCGGVVWLMRRR